MSGYEARTKGTLATLALLLALTTIISLGVSGSLLHVYYKGKDNKTISDKTWKNYRIFAWAGIASGVISCVLCIILAKVNTME